MTDTDPTDNRPPGEGAHEPQMTDCTFAGDGPLCTWCKDPPENHRSNARPHKFQWTSGMCRLCGQDRNEPIHNSKAFPDLPGLDLAARPPATEPGPCPGCGVFAHRPDCALKGAREAALAKAQLDAKQFEQDVLKYFNQCEASGVALSAARAELARQKALAELYAPSAQQFRELYDTIHKSNPTVYALLVEFFHGNLRDSQQALHRSLSEVVNTALEQRREAESALAASRARVGEITARYNEWREDSEKQRDLRATAESETARLRAEVETLKAQIEFDNKNGEACLDEIAEALGCAEWDYPGQLIRDAEAMTARADKAEAQLAEVRGELERAERRRYSNVEGLKSANESLRVADDKLFAELRAEVASLQADKAAALVVIEWLKMLVEGRPQRTGDQHGRYLDAKRRLGL